MLLNFKGNPPPELIGLHANYTEPWCVSESEGKMSCHRECEINYFTGVFVAASLLCLRFLARRLYSLTSWSRRKLEVALMNTPVCVSVCVCVCSVWEGVATTGVFSISKTNSRTSTSALISLLVHPCLSVISLHLHHPHCCFLNSSLSVCPHPTPPLFTQLYSL